MSKQDISPFDELKSVMENPAKIKGISYRIPGFLKDGIDIGIILDNGMEHSLPLERDHVPIVHKDNDGNIYIYEIKASVHCPAHEWYTKFDRTIEIIAMGENSKGFYHQMVS